MRYAILIENDRVIVEFSEGDFKKILLIYFEQTKDIDKAFDLTKEALTNKVRKL
jgi:hypothetical protein